MLHFAGKQKIEQPKGGKLRFYFMAILPSPTWVIQIELYTLFTDAST